MEGKVLAGRYRLFNKLGQGGMGSVWRAEHLTLGSPLAIKLIDSGIAQSSEALGRFKREAQAAAELRSAHVVQIFDFGVDGDVPFIAMELLEGESLARRLEHVHRLTPGQVAHILTQVGKALQRAHQAGIVHRDLKPDNIFIVRESDDELVKVLDFGIAKKLDSLSTSSGVKTNTGAMLGTPYYMSPEQALGQSNIDRRADIWSLGIIAYECLTGSRPFEKDTLGALLMAICNDPLPTPSRIANVPTGFDAWFARAAARLQGQRFESATDATAELRRICSPDSERPTIESKQAAKVDTLVSQGPSASATELLKPASEMAETAAPASVTIPDFKSRRSIRFVLLLLGIAIGGIGVIWIARIAMTQQPRAETKSAATETAPGDPTAYEPRSIPANNATDVTPLGAIGKGHEVSNGPITNINDLPEVSEVNAPEKRPSNLKPNASAVPTRIPTPALSSATLKPATLKTPDAPASPNRRDYTKDPGFSDDYIQFGSGVAIAFLPSDFFACPRTRRNSSIYG